MEETNNKEKIFAIMKKISLWYNKSKEVWIFYLKIEKKYGKASNCALIYQKYYFLLIYYQNLLINQAH